MKFNEAIDIIRGAGNCAVDCPGLWVPSTFEWIETNTRLIQEMKDRGENLNGNIRATRIYENSISIVDSMLNDLNIYEAGTLKDSPYSIYPLKK